MHRFRSSWLALVGGALLIAFSVSAAFGAPPTEPTRGQTIAAFVHELVFGTDDDVPEANEEEQQTEESEESDTESEDGAETGTHGECVSEVARDKDAVGGPNDNHGGAVSEAARETCRTDADAEADLEEKSAGSEDELSARERRAAERAAARAEREAARAEREAARAERKADAQGNAGGNGHGRGGSRR